TLYDSAVQFRLIRPITERFTADIAVSPGMYGDYKIESGDTFRLTGRGFGVFKWTEQTTLIAGVAYFDRPDVAVLPVGGVIWTPSDVWRLELLFPRPKFARRVFAIPSHDPRATEPAEAYWLYLSGEFGGGIWSIRRASGDSDVITMRDYRVILG